MDRTRNSPLATVVPGPTEHLAVDLLLARLKGEAPEAGLRIPVTVDPASSPRRS
ncbi:hypothetical protein [Arthrobacter crystallopoietes]|uniref:hypothetical protein n=1 Tax=Crystallibacter crystallopoietes TaxID=37928 RepID=UPI001F20EFB7|nr:hypothetical protein [Arthrobacter crystallopoietes]